MGPLYAYFHSHSSSKLNLAPSKHFHVRHAPLNLLFKLNFLYNTFSNPIPLIPLVTLVWAQSLIRRAQNKCYTKSKGLSLRSQLDTPQEKSLRSLLSSHLGYR